MFRLLFVISCLLLIMTIPAGAANKRFSPPVEIDGTPVKLLGQPAVLSTADTCAAFNVDEAIYYEPDWVIGDELYKVYLDPELSCPNPYPYSVTEVHILMRFTGATPISFSADIEEVDLSNRVLGSALRTETIRTWLEIRLEDRLEHQFQRGLHNPVSDSRDPELADFAARLRDRLLPHPLRLEAAGLEIISQPTEQRLNTGGD